MSAALRTCSSTTTLNPEHQIVAVSVADESSYCRLIFQSPVFRILPFPLTCQDEIGTDGGPERALRIKLTVNVYSPMIEQRTQCYVSKSDT